MSITSNDPAALVLGEEYVPPGEDSAIEAITTLNLEMLDTSKKPVRRGQHPKHHGCVEAELLVAPDLPPDLRHGLFEAQRTYRALIRFSNSKQQDDTKADAHGMAIKVLDVGPNREPGAPPGRGTTQDFVLVDHPVFFIRNAADYVSFSRALRNAARSRLRRNLSFLPKAAELIGLFFLYRGFFSRHKHEFRILRQITGKKPLSPLQIQYWSATPYRLGPHAVRFSARPDVAGITAPPASRSPNRLREAMSAHLKDQEARFDLLVQLQTDPVAMPIEDPTIPWDEGVSPLRKIATVRIAPQAFETDERMALGENLSFSPWHTLPEHRPLGGINRVRKGVYEALSKRRHELNGVATGNGASV